jgi:pimeloyl-ACP methyl ester carboxylesterase
MWYANIAPLSEHFRIYAPDIINQTGLSVAKRLPGTAQECAEWLSQVLNAFNIESASFIGHSYGGWLLLKFAMCFPQRVKRMVLLAPAPAFASQSKQLILRMMAVLFMPVKSTFYWFFQWMTTLPLGNDHIFIEQLITGMKSFKPEKMTMAVMSVYTDEDLTQLNTPTLLLIGEKEVVYNPYRVLVRAKRLLPDIQAELIPNASHLLPIEQAETVNRKILAFLNS